MNKLSMIGIVLPGQRSWTEMKAAPLLRSRPILASQQSTQVPE